MNSSFSPLGWRQTKVYKSTYGRIAVASGKSSVLLLSNNHKT